VPFDAHVLLFALGALLVSGVLVGLAPALRLAATDIKSLMNAGGRSATSGRAQHRTLATMIVAEIALAIVLVARKSLDTEQATATHDARPQPAVGRGSLNRTSASRKPTLVPRRRIHSPSGG
jgi:hypothetical protein